ncbi:hypothetical protein ACIQ6K_35500 [Streptomyces sp. NPDC096354]
MVPSVERLFGYLSHDATRCGAHRNIQALKAYIRAWVKEWN